MTFRVTDQGPGIPGDKQALLFTRFFQLDPADRGGIGLGLSIAQAIVEAHRGRIWVRSQPGEGSTFAFELPASVSAAAERERNPSR